MQYERDRLAVVVQDVPIFRAARNVDVVGKPDFAYRTGSSPMASTLHGALILLRLLGAWDWFVNLSGDDYPLVTQDELLHIMSHFPKELNFVNHTSYIGWKESRRLKPVIVDPGLYLVEKKTMFYASQKRELPKAGYTSPNIKDHEGGEFFSDSEEEEEEEVGAEVPATITANGNAAKAKPAEVKKNVKPETADDDEDDSDVIFPSYQSHKDCQRIAFDVEKVYH